MLICLSACKGNPTTSDTTQGSSTTKQTTTTAESESSEERTSEESTLEETSSEETSSEVSTEETSSEVTSEESSSEASSEESTSTESSEESSSDTQEKADESSETSEVSETEPVSETTEELKLPEEGQAFELGQTIEFKDFKVSIDELKLVEDLDGKPLLKFTYTWSHSKSDVSSPMFTFRLLGFQEDKQTEIRLAVSMEVDQKALLEEVAAGKEVKGDGSVIIDDVSKPMTLQLTPVVNLDNTIYTYEIPDLNALK